ncbi:hypothetical protein [Tautonia rosea]|uniref:hypothetical protein n=1 Tax=Tautonia rosea TaxID=2728037 RepID=UPI0014761D81|nr:hypothetical protein [Tautonia rosea]
MTLFRVYLIGVMVCLSGYTVVVGIQHGWNLLPLFFSSIAEMSWPGQFNLDFMTFLGLSGIWVAWRHEFTGRGIALGIVAFLGGMMFLAPYLLWASVQAEGDMKVLLLGKTRAAV